MNEASATFAWGTLSEDFALFRTLSSEQRMTALNAMVRLDLVRGEGLVAQGGPSGAELLKMTRYSDARSR
jgi:NTE family protein